MLFIVPVAFCHSLKLKNTLKMNSENFLLVTSVMCKRLKNKNVWEKSNYRKKIKLAYLAYLTIKVNEENSKLFKRRRIWTRPIFTEETRNLYGCGNTLFHELENDNSKFFNYFRMSSAMFFKLLNVLENKIKKQDLIRNPISPKIRLAITLRFLASGDSMKSLSYAFRVAPQTISQIISEICLEIWDSLADQLLKLPTIEDWKAIAHEFEIKWNFPHCIGALDGKHVIIQAPPNSGSTFYNYKNSHSLILMAVADANLCFILVDIGAPGRKSDGGVFRNSDMGTGFEKNLLHVPEEDPVTLTDNLILPYVLVGDEAFALTNYMMRPYPRSGNLNRRQKIFNYRLSRARRLIECAFGLLRGRWRIFAKPINASIETTKRIIQATICLHNFIMKNELSMPHTERAYSKLDSTNEISGGLTDVGRTGSNAYSRNAANTRDRFAEYFETVGAVPWQWQKIANNDF